jgi:maltose-binding protein MalE
MRAPIPAAALSAFLAALLSLAAAAPARGGGRAEPPARPAGLVLWCADTAPGITALAGRLAREFTEGTPGAALRVEAHDPLALADELAAAVSSGTAPDLVWAGWGALPALSGAGQIAPVDRLFDLRLFSPAAASAMRAGRRAWGVPVSAYGLLVLLVNRDLVASPPGTTDELLAACARLSAAGSVGLAWNRAEPYWAVPWIHGFRGRLLDEAGVPSFGTPQVQDALGFLADLASAPGAAPEGTDSYEAGRLFDTGAAAMIVDGDWQVPDHRQALGARLTAARLPRVSATGEWARPCVTGTCLMITPGIEGERRDAVRRFVLFATGREKQLDLARTLPQLPALREALADPEVKGDPVRGVLAEELEGAEPLPEGPLMRCAWKAMKEVLPGVMARRLSPPQGAAEMERIAGGCSGAR